MNNIKEKEQQNLSSSGFFSSGKSQSENQNNENTHQHFDFTREILKMLNMRVTVILLVVSVLGTVSYSLEYSGIENQRKTRLEYSDEL